MRAPARAVQTVAGRCAPTRGRILPELRAEAEHQAHCPSPQKHKAVVISAARVHLGVLVRRLGDVLEVLARGWRNSGSQKKRRRREKEVKACGAFPVIFQNPVTTSMSWEEALGRAKLAEDAGDALFPLSSTQLRAVHDLLQVSPMVSLERIMLEVSDSDPAGATSTDISKQLVEHLPVFAVDLGTAVLEPQRAKQQFVGTFLHPLGNLSFQSLLLGTKERFQKLGFLGWKCESQQDDSNQEPRQEDDDEPCAAEKEEAAYCGTRPGPPLPEEAMPAMAQFLTDYAHSRGQMSMKDKGRLQPSHEVFGAPLTKLLEALQAAGIRVSRSQQECDLTPPVMKDAAKRWHARGDFSRAFVRYAKEFIQNHQRTSGLRQGVHACRRVKQVHLAAMMKTPIWIAARNEGRAGFELQRVDGKPVLTATDHSVPLGKRCWISLSGITECTGDIGGRTSEARSGQGAPKNVTPLAL